MRSLTMMTAVGVLMLALPASVPAFTHPSEYSGNLDNYRYCAGNDPLATCTYPEARSPSLYFLTNGTKGSFSYTSNSAKIRIDSIEIDTTHPAWPCISQSYTCTAKAGSGCGSGKTCQAGPKANSCCFSDSDCGAVACNGGPQDDGACQNDNDCLKMDGSKHWSFVLRGNETSYTPGGPIPWPYALHGDDGTGCLVVCDFTLDTDSNLFVGSINTNGVGCHMSGDCTTRSTFHHAEIVDPDGHVLAIPALGTATISDNFTNDQHDPAKLGDVCRTSPNPPADCQ